VDLNKPEWLAQMEGILETLNEGVLIVDDCNHVLFVNDCMLQMVGRTAEEVLGHGPSSFFQGEDLGFVNKQSAPAAVTGINRYEFSLPRRDGSRMPVVVGAREVEDPDGRVFTVLTFTDITEQKSAQERLRAANLQLENRAREIEAELQLAQRVQQSLAPRCLRAGRVAVETFYLPVSSIGGDFGLVTPFADGEVDLLVCDVSGHGISSALIANRIYTETMSLLERRVAVGEMLRQLNRFVVQQIRVGGFFFTMAAARVLEGGNRLHFASGGHPPAIWVAPSGETRLLDSRSTVLGLLEDAVPPRNVQEYDLAPGDRLVLYTDGFIEVWNQRAEQLGIEGFNEIVRQAARKPITEMKQAILGGVAAFRHGPPADDMSLILLEVQ
jgi:PAS domain S-box-containing protein